jgi:hypothetical protein
MSVIGFFHGAKSEPQTSESRAGFILISSEFPSEPLGAPLASAVVKIIFQPAHPGRQGCPPRIDQSPRNRTSMESFAANSQVYPQMEQPINADGK